MSLTILCQPRDSRQATVVDYSRERETKGIVERRDQVQEPEWKGRGRTYVQQANPIKQLRHTPDSGSKTSSGAK